MSATRRLEDALRDALPGLAKVQALTVSEVEAHSRKSELRWLASRIAQSNRRAAKRIGMSESTLRGLCDHRALNRVPSDKQLDRARDLMQADDLRARANLLEAV